MGCLTTKKLALLHAGMQDPVRSVGLANAVCLVPLRLEIALPQMDYQHPPISVFLHNLVLIQVEHCGY